MEFINSFKQKIRSRREKEVGRGSPASATTEQISTLAPVSAAAPAKLPSERPGPSDPLSRGRPQSPSRPESPSHPPTTLSIRPADQPSVSGTPSTSESLDLWKLAYDKFRTEAAQDLLVGYNTHVLGNAAADTDLSSRDSIEKALDNLLTNRENRQWKVHILGRDINIRAQFERLTKILQWSDPLVKSTIITQTYAALAWSGVSLLLPLLTSGTTQNEEMLEGFSSIGELQKFWQIQEKISFQSEHQDHYQVVIEPLIELYSLFFAYQAHVICHLTKTQLSRAWGDLSSPELWRSKTEDINKQSKNCCRLIGVSRESEIQENRDGLLQAIQKQQESTERHIRNEQEENLLGDLAEAAGDYERYKDLNPKRVPGTCEWFLKDERFHKWRDGATSSLIWVSAGPGRGKSVLSKCLLDENQLATTTITITTPSNEPATSKQSTVCYFFFKDGGDGRMDSAQALCALLHQLFTCPSTSRLIEYALESHRNHQKTLTNKASELWRILLACATSRGSGDIICVIDALDECRNESGQELIKSLKGLYSQSPRLSTDDSKLKFLVTSRPYDNLESSFRKFPEAVYLRFDGDDKSEEIQKEIDLVIDSIVPDLTSGFTDQNQQKISERLKSMEHRTYLWLHLTFDIIKKSPSEYGRALDIEILLSSLPSQVSDAYEKILSRSKDQSWTRIILQIILAATRPLTLDEANVALALAIRKNEPESHSKLKLELWLGKNFKSTVMNLCGLFVSVYDSKLSFIHQTAREFLTDSEPEGTWKGSFNMAQSHHPLLQSCIFYLSFPDIDVFHPPFDLIDDIDGRIKSYGSTEYPFLVYAAKNWPLHFVSQNAADANAFRIQARTLCSATGHQRDVWAPYYFEEYPNSTFDDWKVWPDLTLASYLGLYEAVEDILSKEKPNVNLATEIGRTPLASAITQGHESVVKLLLDNGANMKEQENDGRPPLSLAVWIGQEAVVEVLLKEGANIDAQDRYGWTALSLAARSGQEAAVELLLNNGADIEAKDRFGMTPLSLAACSGQEAVVKLLLKKGADIEAQDFEGQTPLSLAAGYGKWANLWTMLRGFVAIVKLLLEEGAAMETQDHSGQTPLSLATEKGHTAIIELLLNKGKESKLSLSQSISA